MGEIYRNEGADGALMDRRFVPTAHLLPVVRRSTKEAGDGDDENRDDEEGNAKEGQEGGQGGRGVVFACGLLLKAPLKLLSKVDINRIVRLSQNSITNSGEEDGEVPAHGEEVKYVTAKKGLRVAAFVLHPGKPLPHHIVQLVSQASPRTRAAFGYNSQPGDDAGSPLSPAALTADGIENGGDISIDGGDFKYLDGDHHGSPSFSVIETAGEAGTGDGGSRYLGGSSSSSSSSRHGVSSPTRRVSNITFEAPAAFLLPLFRLTQVQRSPPPFLATMGGEGRGGGGLRVSPPPLSFSPTLLASNGNKAPLLPGYSGPTAPFYLSSSSASSSSASSTSSTNSTIGGGGGGDRLRRVPMGYRPPPTGDSGNFDHHIDAIFDIELSAAGSHSSSASPPPGIAAAAAPAAAGGGGSICAYSASSSSASASSSTDKASYSSSSTSVGGGGGSSGSRSGSRSGGQGRGPGVGGRVVVGGDGDGKVNHHHHQHESHGGGNDDEANSTPLPWLPGSSRRRNSSTPQLSFTDHEDSPRVTSHKQAGWDGVRGLVHMYKSLAQISPQISLEAKDSGSDEDDEDGGEMGRPNASPSFPPPLSPLSPLYRRLDNGGGGGEEESVFGYGGPVAPPGHGSEWSTSALDSGDGGDNPFFSSSLSNPSSLSSSAATAAAAAVEEACWDYPDGNYDGTGGGGGRPQPQALDTRGFLNPRSFSSSSFSSSVIVSSRHPTGRGAHSISTVSTTSALGGSQGGAGGRQQQHHRQRQGFGAGPSFSGGSATGAAAAADAQAVHAERHQAQFLNPMAKKGLRGQLLAAASTAVLATSPLSPSLSVGAGSNRSGGGGSGPRTTSRNTTKKTSKAATSPSRPLVRSASSSSSSSSPSSAASSLFPASTNRKQQQHNLAPFLFEYSKPPPSHHDHNTAAAAAAAAEGKDPSTFPRRLTFSASTQSSVKRTSVVELVTSSLNRFAFKHVCETAPQDRLFVKKDERGSWGGHRSSGGPTGLRYGGGSGHGSGRGLVGDGTSWLSPSAYRPGSSLAQHLRSVDSSFDERMISRGGAPGVAGLMAPWVCSPPASPDHSNGKESSFRERKSSRAGSSERCDDGQLLSTEMAPALSRTGRAGRRAINGFTI